MMLVDDNDRQPIVWEHEAITGNGEEKIYDG